MDINTLINILKKITFLEDINYPLHDLARKMRLVHFYKDENIFCEGEVGTSLYLIISGKVLIYSRTASGRELVLQTLGPLDFFGEMSLLDGGYRSAGARVLERSTMYILERNDFLEFLSSNPGVAIKIIETLSKRLRQSNVLNKILTETNRRLSTHLSNQNQAAVKQDKPGQAPLDKQEQENRKTRGRDLPGAKLDNLENKDGKSLSEILEQSLLNIEQVIEENTEQNPGDKKEIGIEEMLYYKKSVCPVCDTKFESPKVLSKYIQTQKIDYDFCHYYKFVNPLFYEMMVCPACGFAFNEEISKLHFKKEHLDEIKSRLSAFWLDNVLKDYSGIRTLEQVIETFLLALITLKGLPVKNSQMGMLYLKLAWLYRYKGDKAQEQKYIEKAISHLLAAFDKENLSSPKSEINTAYLLGVLNIYMENNREAAKWLDRVLRHPSKSMFPMVLNQTRELWYEVRQKLRAEKQQLEQDN